MNESHSLRCSQAEELLFEGKRSAALHDHLEGCGSCRELSQRLELPAAPPQELTESLLGRLAASSCDRAEELLFGDCSSEERELLDSHLAHCASCSALAQSDAWVRSRLPLLATLEPGEQFTQAVLRRTASRSLARRPQTSRLSRYLGRRQAPLELAYAVAVACVLMIVPAGAPLHSLPTAFAHWLQAGDEDGLRGAGWAEATLVPAANFPAFAVEQGATWTQSLGGGIATRGNQIGWAAGAFGSHAKQFGSALTEREWEELRPVLGEMRCDMHLIFRGARGRLKGPDERC